MGNEALIQAKKAKQDEFYTLIEDIEKEMIYYFDQFKNKIVYCNCDNYRLSNFYKYFKSNFDNLKLKKLIATCITGEIATYNGNTEITGKLNNGDFRRDECIEYLKQADIIVTNPPFSLFREYFAQLIKYDKKFLIMGNMNAITYKEIFPHIKDGQLWLGKSIHCGSTEFQVPKNYEIRTKATRVDADGIRYIKVNGIRWFTNMETNKQVDSPSLIKTYNTEDYPKYDNYNAINVNKIKDIPIDYDGVMGVPITIVDKVCSDGFIYFDTSRFEIVNFRKGDNNKDLAINGYTPYFRVLIKKKKNLK